MSILIIISSFFIISFPSKSQILTPFYFAHRGALNLEGCHNSKEINIYHCHQNSYQQEINRLDYLSVVIEDCYDGDTCKSTQGEKIRLACIDSPELRGPKANPVSAKLARDFLNNKVAGKEVSIRRITKDKYGRSVAELSINGINLQELLVSKGYAIIYKKYSDQCSWASENN
tara:strand:- start:645 stop:1163 length:519 start_codon:yes stop_codon:yes gene_type:complete